jgi:hypothetical protein
VKFIEDFDKVANLILGDTLTKFVAESLTLTITKVPFNPKANLAPI